MFSVSLMLTSVLTMVLSQWATTFFINARGKVNLSTTCQQILGRNCQLWVPVRVSDTLEQVIDMHQLKKSLDNLQSTALSFSQFSFSAVCS